MKVASYNGCKVYNLSSSKALPEWISQAKRRQLSKQDEDFGRRLELIQDFEVSTSAQCITMTPDTEHIIITGVYPPIVKCFTTSDLSLKFQRGLTCEVVAMESLSEDFGKLVFLQADRTLNFHAPYGTHYSLRVPKFGRCLQYNWNNCDLYCGGTGDEIYRLNLESGQFKEPYRLGFEGCNKMHMNSAYQILACVGEQGHCEFWDPRSRKRVASIAIKDQGAVSNDLTAVKFDSDGLTMMLGTASGFCHLFDIRSKQPLYTKEHQYGLPIVDITYHNPSRTILTTDKKLVKVWERDEPNLGRIVTNIETPSDINSVLVASDKKGMSGVIMVAGEQGRIMSYFVPQLGPAPRWCSFLENLTEELEESAKVSVYEDYKFVTRQEVEELGATGLIGTPTLKSYMHGFFMEMKLYNKLRAVSKPFEYEEYRKQKIREKIEAKRQSRISTVKRLPKVNKELAEKLLKKAGDNEADPTKLVDSRFSAIFQRDVFQRDMDNDYFKIHNAVKAKERRKGDESDDELEMYEEIEESDDDKPNNRVHSDSDSDSEFSYDPAGEQDDEAMYGGAKKFDKKKKSIKAYEEEAPKRSSHRDTGNKRTSATAIPRNQGSASGNKKVKMFTLAEGVNTSDVVFADARHQSEKRKNLKVLSRMPMSDRLSANANKGSFGKKRFGK